MASKIKTKRIFISYSRDDYKYAKDLFDYLSGLETSQNPKIDVFMDTEDIESGENWEQKIFPALQSSSAFICLYSKNYFRSSFINSKELPAIGAQVQNDNSKLYGVLIEQFPWKDRTYSDLRLGSQELLGPRDENQRPTPFKHLEKRKQEDWLQSVYDKMKTLLAEFRAVDSLEADGRRGQYASVATSPGRPLQKSVSP